MTFNEYKDKLKEEFYTTPIRESHIRKFAERISEELLQGQILTQNEILERMTGVEFCEEVINATIAMVHRIVMSRGKCLVSVPVIDIKHSDTMNVVISGINYKAVSPVITEQKFFGKYF